MAATCGLTFFLCLMASCSNGRNGEVSRLEEAVDQMLGREIIVPSALDFETQDDGFLQLKGKDPDFTIIHYVDSAGCTPCRMRLAQWKELMARLDSVQPSLNIGCLTIISPGDEASEEKARASVERERFPFPVAFDRNMRYEKDNLLPAHDVSRVLLLDKKMRVVALGDPVVNPRVEDVYMEVITGKKGATAEEAPLTAVSAADEADTGRLPLGAEAQYVWTLKNTGDNPLVIRRVTSSCDCATAVYSPTPVAPGGSARITLRVKAEEKGGWMRRYEAWCNTSDSPVAIEIEGEAK